MPKSKINQNRESLENDNFDDTENTQIHTIDLPGDESDLDSLIDEFSTETPDARIQLYRRQPRTYKGKEVHGYLCELVAGDTVETIKEKYGGGTFGLKFRNKGKYVKHSTVSIAGPPKVDTAPDEGTGDDAVKEKTLNPDLRYGDIPIGGDMREFWQIVQRIKILEALYPQKPDLNTEIMNMMLTVINSKASPANETLDQLDKLSGLIERLSDRGSGGGNNWAEIAGTFLEYLNSRSVPAQPGNTPSRTPQSGTLQGQVPQITENKANMGIDQIVQTGIGQIITSFMAGDQSPLDTVEILKLVLPPIDTSIAERINASRSVLWNLAKNNISTLYEQDDPDQEKEFIEKFRLHFNSTLDILTGENQTNLQNEKVQNDGQNRNPEIGDDQIA